MEEFEEIEDDKVIQAEPMPSIPWMEAYFSSVIKYSGHHIWAEKKHDNNINSFKVENDESWLEKYLEFLDILNTSFNKRWAISQTILRGLSDVACSIIGESNLLYAMYDEPRKVHNLLDFCKDRSIYFIKSNKRKYKNSMVVM